jgi:hypothetical protein
MNPPATAPWLHQPLLHIVSEMAALAYPDPRPRAQLGPLALGLLAGPLPKTVTSALDFLGLAQEDWSSAYRLFSQSQCQPQAFFQPVLRRALAPGLPTASLVLLAQDDTLLRKTGPKIPGVRYLRDPLSPPFHVNLVRGQRFVQTAWLSRPTQPEHPWRALPVRWDHAPVPKAPCHATPEQKARVQKERKKRRVSLVALEQLRQIRQEVDAFGGSDRWLLDVVDGTYANRTFLQHLPPRTEAVARFRYDARLCAYLPPGQRRGIRKYGPTLPTPQAFLRDEQIPWQEMPVWAAGQWHTLRYKVREPVCWPTGTRDQPVRLIVIQPLGYRLRRGSKLLYRQPAYLISTDRTTAVQQEILAYLARWEIEVDFRDEKTVLGVGQAQVRNETAAERLPQFLVALYGALLWCAQDVFGDERTAAFGPLPRWRTRKPYRPSTRDLLRLLQQELDQVGLGHALRAA